MTLAFNKRIEYCALNLIDTLTGIKRGFEKEALRVNQEGLIANTPHPKDLGKSLTHPFITTDYSEALLEFITPPQSEIKASFDFLNDLQSFTNSILQDEILWATSMPCHIKDDLHVPIAEYGHSNLGKLKHIYRRGLGHRYGRIMQTIAGVHYNFSLPNAFWVGYHALSNSNLSLKDFVSEQYLSMIRNCLRYGWVLPLLFGASPAVSDSFFQDKSTTLTRWDQDTLIGNYSTSLRLSDLGYHNKIQTLFRVSYNSFSEFINSMKKAVHTPIPEYQKYSLEFNQEYQQLSDCALQIEDEYYGLIRPKRVSAPDERMLSALIREGIEYIELRALDVNPFASCGIEENAVRFLDVFLLTCLFLESPPITEAENKRLQFNHTVMVTEGRKPNVTILDNDNREVLLKTEINHLFDKLKEVAPLLDKAHKTTDYKSACEVAKTKLLEVNSLLSAQVLTDMNVHKESFFEFARRWSLTHNKYFLNRKLTETQKSELIKMAEVSYREQESLEKKNEMPFSQYLSKFLEV